MYHISCEQEINTEELMKLLKQTYWAAERPKELVEKSLANSVNYGAFDESGRLIGFARVVTDFVCIYYVCDVVVDEKHRRFGIGKALVDAIVSDERFAHIGALLKTKDAHGWYRKYGFQDVDPGRVMYR